MTQAFNLSQLANFVNTSGQLSLTTGVTGTLPIANGGTNNGSLAVTAGGVIYTDGSKMVNVGAGTSGQILTSQGASAPVWNTLSVSGTLKNIKYFTSGTSTYTPTSGTTFVVVEVVGGGGGNYGTGAGGTTSFGALVSATGGAVGGTSGVFASGGSGSGGDLNITGGTGGAGAATTTTPGAAGGCPAFYGVMQGVGGYNFGSGTPCGYGVGGGYTGSSARGGGGGGGYARKRITSGFSGVTVTIGGGGGGIATGGICVVYEYA